MSTLTTADGVQLHVTDTGGEGRPLVLVHGWPLSGAAFEGNIPAFVAAGYRVVTYDRRGFGQSDKPDAGYDYETLTDDLAEVLEQLDLTDAVVLGFSMGGGEAARIAGGRRHPRVGAVIFSGSIAPALCLTDDNPDGAMPFEAFQGMSDQCAADRDGFLDQFVTWFYSTENDGLRVDEETRQAALAIAQQSSPVAGPATILIWAEDLREDCRRIEVPTLVIHGDGDINVPLAKSSARMPDYVPGARLVVIEGAPHGANVSHAGQWESAILDFLAERG
ncbi:MAG: alpha/beta hydrolase [Arachnia sp.]